MTYLNETTFTDLYFFFVLFYVYSQAFRRENWTFQKLEMMVFTVNLCHLTTVLPVELPCECLFQLTMEITR